MSATRRPPAGAPRRQTRRVRSRVAALVVAVSLVGASCAGPGQPSPSPTRTLTEYPEFAPSNVYEVDISKAPVDPRSAPMVRGLAAQVENHWGGTAAFNNTQYNTVIYRADASTPRTRVEFDDCQNKGEVPPGLHDGDGHFLDVPVPADATTAKGTDSTMSIWSAETDQLWEFWVMDKRPDGKWQACWGGRIDHVSQSAGQFPHPYGVSASGLAMVGTTITIPEAQALRIDHAIGVGLIDVKAGEQRYPANRNDGTSTEPDAIPEGTRLRLDQSIDVDSLGLSPLAAAVARAAQTYGFIVVDRAGAVGIGAESSAPRVAEGKPDPWPGILGDVPSYSLLDGFPWDRLEVVDASFASPAG